MFCTVRRIQRVNTPPPQRYIILGKTHGGKVFRPSDWAERLCGVMAEYRPGYQPGALRRMIQGFSPYAQPVVRDGLKCVVIDRRIEALEPMAWQFVCGFARDNDLPMKADIEDGSGSAVGV